jgi:hypothetical protein
MFLLEIKYTSTIFLEDIYVLDRYIIARTMDDFEKVSFPDLWARLKPWLHKHYAGHMAKTLRGKRETYKT